MGWWRWLAQIAAEDRKLDELLKSRGARLRAQQQTQKINEPLRQKAAARRVHAEAVRQRAAAILAEPVDQSSPSGDVVPWPHRR